MSNGINLPDPGQLYTASKDHPNTIVEIYNGPASKYDSKQTDKKLRKLLKSSFLGIDESVDILHEVVLPAGYSLRPANETDKKYVVNRSDINIEMKRLDDITKSMNKTIEEMTRLIREGKI